MEDELGRLAVIVAGYPANMETFITSNPGLQLRFTTEIVFEDYNPSQPVYLQSANEMLKSMYEKLQLG